MLNIRQRKFVKLYTTGGEEFRGNAVACYWACGYKPKTNHAAEVAASRLLKNVEINNYLLALEAESRARVIQQLQDWKELAPDAQRRIRAIMMGFLPDPLSTAEQIIVYLNILQQARETPAYK